MSAEMISFDAYPWQHWAQHTPDAVALRLEDKTVSWRDLQLTVGQYAAGFMLQGVHPDTTVALLGKNSETMLYSYLALLQLQVQVLPINPALPDEQRDAILARCQAEFILGAEQGTTSSNLKSLEAKPSLARIVNQFPFDAQRIATLTLTSGSTGLPKAAAHSMAAHLASAQGVLSLMTFSPMDSWLLSLPLFHVSGQGIIWRWLQAGACLVLSEKTLVAALQDCSHASLVPTQLRRILEGDTVQLALKEVLLGGAAIPNELTVQAKEKGIACFCGYGLTEFASTVCAKASDDKGSVGQPLLGKQIKLVNDEVWIKADSAALGYWCDGILTPITDSEGWFHSRDKGCFEGSELRLLGRLDNQFISGGEGIQPEDIEAVLLTHPDISQAFILPIDDVEFGQRPVAIIDSTTGLTLDDIQQFLANKVARFQLPITVYAMPKDLVQGIKVSRKQLANWLGKQ